MSTPLNLSVYSEHLEQARTELQLAVIDFDPNAHPRDWRGRFKTGLRGMKRHDVRAFPSGVKVEKKYANYKVTSPDGKSISPKTLDETITHAMRFDAATTHPQSIGGTTSTTVGEAESKAEGQVPPRVARDAFDALGLQHRHLLDNQLPSARRHILDIVDPAGQPPAKDGAEALKRLRAINQGAGPKLGRGASSISIGVPNLAGIGHEDRVWKAIEQLRGDYAQDRTAAPAQPGSAVSSSNSDFASVAAELRQMSNDTTDRYASEHGAADKAEQLARAAGPKGNPKFDLPGRAKELAQGLRSITWGPNLARLTQLAGAIDKARQRDYDEHISKLRSQMAGETHYTPESLAQSRDMAQEIRDALEYGDNHVTVKIPSGTEMGLTYRQAHHLRHGRPT